MLTAHERAMIKYVLDRVSASPSLSRHSVDSVFLDYILEREETLGQPNLDTVRLDWIEANKADVDHNHDGWRVFWSDCEDVECKLSRVSSAREAIDAAMMF